MNEEEIIQQVYSLYEGDVDDWSATDDEYLSARRYSKGGIFMWEHYDNTKWRELFGTLTAAATGDKTTTAGDFLYDCPTNFKSLSSYVRTSSSGGVKTFFIPQPPEKIALLTKSSENFVYITGNRKDGFDLNFNPNLVLATGDTIEYEYYRLATYFTATSSITEMSNPFFLVHYILYRMYKNDGEDGKAREEFQIAQQLLEQMRVDNMESLWNVPFNIDEDPTTRGGFGV